MHCTCTPRLCAVATVHDVLVAHVAARVRRKVRIFTEKAEQHRRAARRAVATARLRQREQRVSRVAVCREDGVESTWSARAWKVRGKCVECAYSQVAGRNKRRRVLVFGAVCMASWQALALPRRCSGPLQCDGAASGLDAASGRGRRRPSVNQRSRHPEGPRQSCARAPRRPPPRGTPSKPATAPVSARAPARPQEFPFSPTHCAPPSH